jgi:hypothetical protein
MTSVCIFTWSGFRKLALLQLVESYTIAEPVYVNMQRVQSISRLVYLRKIDTEFDHCLQRRVGITHFFSFMLMVETDHCTYICAFLI